MGWRARDFGLRAIMSGKLMGMEEGKKINIAFVDIWRGRGHVGKITQSQRPLLLQPWREREADILKAAAMATHCLLQRPSRPGWGCRPLLLRGEGREKQMLTRWWARCGERRKMLVLKLREFDGQVRWEEREKKAQGRIERVLTKSGDTMRNSMMMAVVAMISSMHWEKRERDFSLKRFELDADGQGMCREWWE